MNIDHNPLGMLSEIVISTVEMNRSIDDIFNLIRDASLVILSREIITQITENKNPSIVNLTSFQAFSYILVQLCNLTFHQLDLIDLKPDDPHHQYILSLKDKLGALLLKKDNILH